MALKSANAVICNPILWWAGSKCSLWVGCLTLKSQATVPCRGVAKLVKAPDFDSGIRRFDSFHPCQIFSRPMRCMGRYLVQAHALHEPEFIWVNP